MQKRQPRRMTGRTTQRTTNSTVQAAGKIIMILRHEDTLARAHQNCCCDRLIHKPYIMCMQHVSLRGGGCSVRGVSAGQRKDGAASTRLYFNNNASRGTIKRKRGREGGRERESGRERERERERERLLSPFSTAPGRPTRGVQP